MDLTPAIEIDGKLYVPADEFNKMREIHADLRNQFLLLEQRTATAQSEVTATVNPIPALQKELFIQQYVLARASRIDSHPAISAMVKDAERAHELIVKTCNKEDN